jgi:hypothetical protein
VWAEPCGTSARQPLYRIVNIPFLHAKPTWGDVLVAPHSRDYGHPAWDRAGVAFAKVGTRIHTDGGRYAAIVDYQLEPPADFKRLCQALWAKHKVQTEGAWGPKGREPGRLYLAVPGTLSVVALLEELGAMAGWHFTLVHPKVAKAKAPPTRAKKATAKKTTKKASATKASTKKASTKKTAKTPRPAKKAKR